MKLGLLILVRESCGLVKAVVVRHSIWEAQPDSRGDVWASGNTGLRLAPDERIVHVSVLETSHEPPE